jgi:hypothetical protein
MKKEFENLTELSSDPIFRANVAKEIEALKRTRNKARSAVKKEGARFKHDWLDRFDRDNMNVDYFVQNIGPVWDKTSTLSAEKRTVLKIVCNKALKNTFEQYDKIKEDEKAN